MTRVVRLDRVVREARVTRVVRVGHVDQEAREGTSGPDNPAIPRGDEADRRAGTDATKMEGTLDARMSAGAAPGTKDAGQETGAARRTRETTDPPTHRKTRDDLGAVAKITGHRRHEAARIVTHGVTHGATHGATIDAKGRGMIDGGGRADVRFAASTRKQTAAQPGPQSDEFPSPSRSNAPIFLPASAVPEWAALIQNS